MSDKKKTQNALLEAISIMIDKKLQKLGFNYYVDGVITQKNKDYTYNVLINNTPYNNIPAQHQAVYSVGDTVQVLIKNGNWNKKFITDTSFHNKFLTSKYYMCTDGTETQFPLIGHNGSNIWIGASKSDSKHHAGKDGYGKVYISSGYNTEKNKGNETIYVAVPNDTNNDAKMYKVIHANNLIDYVYPVGSIYISVNNVSPKSFIGGTWEKLNGSLQSDTTCYMWKRTA